MAGPKVLLAGISGPSSSGKTTLSRLLRDILPNTTILHEDDFYKPDSEIPTKDGIADWDCIESLDLNRLHGTLEYIKTHGHVPPALHSKEDQNSVGETVVDEQVVAALKEEAQRWSKVCTTPIVIVDGFLLFGESMGVIRSLFDVRLFLRADYATVKGRREARKGYVTLEGFWEDPPGYVDKIVWPNYVNDHRFLFEGGDVEGKVDAEVIGQTKIEVMPDKAQGNMTKCLEWAYKSVTKALWWES